jgi:hypothetical protein
MIDKGNRNTRRKLALLSLCPPQIPHDIPGRRSGKPVTNRRSYGLPPPDPPVLSTEREGYAIA